LIDIFSGNFVTFWLRLPDKWLISIPEKKGAGISTSPFAY
jgi:hypothetical protein